MTAALNAFAGRQEIRRIGPFVYELATDPTFDRQVLLKRAIDPSDAPAVAALEQEARTVARLQHAGIVAVHALIQTDAGPIAMKRWMGRETLATTDASQPRRIEIAIEVCRALAYAHSEGVVHLAIRPECVRLGAFGEVVLADWSRANDSHRGQPITDRLIQRDLADLARALVEVSDPNPHLTEVCGRAEQGEYATATELADSLQGVARRLDASRLFASLPWEPGNDPLDLETQLDQLAVVLAIWPDYPQALEARRYAQEQLIGAYLAADDVEEAKRALAELTDPPTDLIANTAAAAQRRDSARQAQETLHQYTRDQLASLPLLRRTAFLMWAFIVIGTAAVVAGGGAASLAGPVAATVAAGAAAALMARHRAPIARTHTGRESATLGLACLVALAIYRWYAYSAGLSSQEMALSELPLFATGLLVAGALHWLFLTVGALFMALAMAGAATDSARVLFDLSLHLIPLTLLYVARDRPELRPRI